MPEQQVAGPGEHAHTLEARGLAYVARAAVCRMQPQHIGLGTQAQVIADSSVYRGLRTLPAVTSAHGEGRPGVVGGRGSRLRRFIIAPPPSWEQAAQPPSLGNS
jgi:hypothetical protein